MRDSIWRSKVRSLIGIMFIGSFALGAGLIIWHAASGKNPVEEAFTLEIANETQLH